MRGDLQRQCASCGSDYWWTVAEQRRCRQRNLKAPARCPSCRDTRRRAQRTKRARNTSLVRTKSETQTLAPFGQDGASAGAIQLLDRRALVADLEQLLADAAAPVIERRRTFIEWLRGVDVRATQIAQKMQAARTADEMVRQRTALLKHMHEMFEVATNAQLARLEREIRLREAQLRIQQLENSIQTYPALADSKRRTQGLEDEVRRHRLAKDLTPEEPLEQRTVREERRRLNVRSEARQGILSDFLREVDRVCEGPSSVHEKSLRIREVLAAFEMDDESLPEYAARLLRASERLRDGS